MATGEETVCIPRYMGETDHEAECFTIECTISSLKPYDCPYIMHLHFGDTSTPQELVGVDVSGRLSRRDSS